MSAEPLSGSCLCGAVTYDVTGPPLHFFNCHCSRCRKRFGVAHAMNLIFPPDALTITDGQDKLKRFELSSARSFSSTFCTDCGSPMPHLTRGKTVVIVPAGTLDQDPGIKPEAHIHWASRVPWASEPGGVPCFEEGPGT